jgi:OOP family OmpA-OmpF porin
MNRGILFLIFCIGFTFNTLAQQINKSDFLELLNNINSRYDEQNPILSPDGKMLYFTRANDSLNIGGTRDKGDIWVSQLTSNGIWGRPENLGRPINDDLKNYILGFSPDGTILFLNQEKRNPGGLIINDGIAFSVFANGGWSKPSRVSVDYLINKSKHQSGAVSADGRLMLLSLQAYASRGEEDIYICSYENGKWTQPINLGSDINSSGQEMTPYLSADKKQLYFSSNGHGGKGGRDLFVSERKGEGWTSWSRPKNLGAEVNSFGVEMNYFIDSKNKVAYFSSTQNSDGYGDIKMHDITIEIEEDSIVNEVFEELVVIAEEARKTLRFSGIIYNNSTNEPISAALNIEVDGMNVNINSDEGNGTFEVELPLTLPQVIVQVKAPGYMSATEEVLLDGNDFEKNFSLPPLDVGATIQLNKVYFKRGTAELLEESFVELDQVVDMMNENQLVKIELSGHTDNQGSSKLNIKLSQERVEKAKRYLTEHGIEGKRIKGKGYGGTKAVASNASEETRKLNRRVEITILKN